ncbi:uncharacterized protein EDB93DRAFT_1334742 [Suillus bovinus]|uniref:uncharacterized protein n=1 Tax=Suillus bovinus TaxID=48563 RepID=UPI001B87CD4F|nr:uncharacterized protein EDB93DRAFT_1334742 [Suillus bovinus]KAG2158387.1 hypothetical protein EDB93DRAFT_1334742 [Suillus bovinus]
MVAPIVNTGIQTSKYCNVAGLGALIFDYFLTFEREVRWTWNRRWNIARILFVISRYMAFVAAGMTSYAAIATRVNDNVCVLLMWSLNELKDIEYLQCSHYSTASNAIHILSIVAAEGLLVIRTYAFWKQNNKLLAVLLVLAAICIACAAGVTRVVNNIVAQPNSSMPSQATASLKQVAAAPFILMSLMVFKRYQDYRDSDSRLMRTFFQGTVQYMTAIILVSVANILIISVVPQSYDEMMDLPQLVLHICEKVITKPKRHHCNLIDYPTVTIPPIKGTKLQEIVTKLIWFPCFPSALSSSRLLFISSSEIIHLSSTSDGTELAPEVLVDA